MGAVSEDIAAQCAESVRSEPALDDPALDDPALDDPVNEVMSTKTASPTGDTPTYTRGGLNSSEASIAWAVAHFGGDLQACDRLQGAIGRSVEAIVRPVLTLDDPGRFEVLERWREADRACDRLDGLVEDIKQRNSTSYTTPSEVRWVDAFEQIRQGTGGRQRPWRRAHSRTRRAVEWIAIGDLRASLGAIRPELRAHTGFDLVRLGELERNELYFFIRQLGVYQLAELSYRQPRRSLIRLRRRLLPGDQDWFEECILHSEHLQDAARARLHKLFGGISVQGTEMANYLIQIGLYSVSVATSARLRHQMQYVLTQLPRVLARKLRVFNRRAATMPVVITEQLRVTMDVFMERWRRFHTDPSAGSLRRDSDQTPEDMELDDER